MRQVFVDTETTGLDHRAGDRIVEVAAVEMLNRRITGRHLHLYVNPERDMPAEAHAIHGLSRDFLSDKPLFAHVVDELHAFVEGAEVIAHNADFDVAFLDHEFGRLGRDPFARIVGRVVDTLAMARALFPGKSNSLDALCRRLEVDNRHRTLHGALVDAHLLAEVYIRLTRGQNALAIGFDEAGEGEDDDIAVDLRTLVLPVLVASEAELAAHARLMGELDKASGGKAVWARLAEPAPLPLVSALA